MARAPAAWHVWVIPNALVPDCTWSGTYDDMPVEIVPIGLDADNSFLPFGIISQPYCPQSVMDVLSTCSDRVITKEDITA